MVYMYHSFLIHSSADGHPGCFHVLAMINSAAMNIGVHMSLSDLVSLVCTPRSGIAGSYGSSIKIWNASRICVSSLCKGHANLLCIAPILVYVLPKRAPRCVLTRACAPKQQDVQRWNYWRAWSVAWAVVLPSPRSSEGPSVWSGMVREDLTGQGVIWSVPGWGLEFKQAEKTIERFLGREDSRSTAVEMATLKAGLFLQQWIVQLDQAV